MSKVQTCNGKAIQFKDDDDDDEVVRDKIQRFLTS